MKKFDIKKLLVVMLALVLVFALFACDKGGDTPTTPGGGGGGGGGDTPTTINTADYFQKLWDVAGSIGSDNIADTEDLAITLGLNLEVTNGLVGEDETVVDLGIKIDLILDRTSTDEEDSLIAEDPRGAHSAVKVQIYDHADNTNTLTLYFFLDDAKTIYVHFMDQEFKLGLDLGYNDTWASVVDNFIFNNAILNKENASAAVHTIADLVGTLIEGMGPDWSFGSFVNGLLSTFGLNLADLLKIDIIKTLMGSAIDNLSPEEIEKGGLLFLLKALGPVLAPNGTVEVTKNADGSERYVAPVSPAILSAAGGIVGGLEPVKALGLEFGTLFSDLGIALCFGVDANGGIDGFDIELDYFYEDADSEECVFGLNIGINEVSFKGVDAINNKNLLDFTAESFKDYFELEINVDLALENDALLLNMNGVQIQSNGTLNLNVKGYLDLYNAEADNKTAAYATLKYGSAIVAEASYSGAPGTLALKVDNSVTIAVIANGTTVQVPLTKLFAESVGVEIVKALQNATKIVWYDANGSGKEDVGDEYYSVEDEILRGIGVMLDSYLFDANDAYKLSFQGFAITNIDFLSLFQGLFAEKTTEKVDNRPAVATAETPVVYATWKINLGTIVNLVANAVGTTSDGKAEIAVEKFGDTIASIFSNVTLTQMLFGNNDNKNKIDGFFGNNGTANKLGSFKFNEWFAGSAWIGATEEETIENLFNSNAQVTLDLDGAFSLGVKVTNGEASVSIGISIDLTAKDELPTYTAIEVPTAPDAGWMILNLAALTA